MSYHTESWTENIVKELPKNIQKKVIQLLKDELNKLKEEFYKL